MSNPSPLTSSSHYHLNKTIKILNISILSHYPSLCLFHTHTHTLSSAVLKCCINHLKSLVNMQAKSKAAQLSAYLTAQCFSTSVDQRRTTCIYTFIHSTETCSSSTLHYQRERASDLTGHQHTVENTVFSCLAGCVHMCVYSSDTAGELDGLKPHSGLNCSVMKLP